MIHVAEYKENKNYISGRGKYYKIRKYDTDIHIYETGNNESLEIIFGKYDKKEKLSDIIKYNSNNVVAAINGGFFNTKGKRKHYGSLGINGTHYYNPNPKYIDFIIYLDGHSEIKHISNYNECIKLQRQKAIYFGTSWSLVRNGKVDIINTKMNHHKYRHPRTMLGHRKDGKWVLVVSDGRIKNSKGLTSFEQAEVMYTLKTYNAVNLDGGKSSEMIVGKEIKNFLSNKVERKIGSSIIVNWLPNIKRYNHI